MNYVIIFFSEIIQNIWWIILTFVISIDNQFIIIGLSSVGVILKFVILKTFKNSLQLNWFCYTPILLLINTIIYTETNLLMYKVGNPFSNHTCTLFIVVNQQIIKDLVFDKVSYHIFAYCYPCYVMLRLFSLTFINFDYYILESVVIVSVFTSLLISEKNQSLKNQRLSLQMLEENDSKGYQSRRLQESSFFLQNNKPLKQGSAQLFYFNNDNNIFNSSNLKKQQSDLTEIRINVSSQSLKNRETDLSLGQIPNLLNHFSEGIMIIDSSQQVLFMNRKIEKFFQTTKHEDALKILKQCLANLQISSNKQLDQPPVCPKKLVINQALVEDIVSYFEIHNLELDIVELLLNPQKYLSIYKGYEKQISEGILEISSQENQIKFDAQVGSRNLQIRITPTRYHNQKALNNNNIETGISQQILLVVIKNVTTLIQLEEADKEFQVHNTLLKQFSYELRAPININQQFLNLVFDLVSESQIKELIEITSITNQQQIYQINDILDYTAIRDNKFKYNFQRFVFNEIIIEIERIFQKQMKLKNIKFQIEYQQFLIDHQINSDKFRILQILVNLLNNSCKTARQREEIKLSFISLDDSFIEVKITDSGTDIDQIKLAALKNRDSKNNFDKNKLKDQHELWLGFFVSRNIVEGLIETGDNFFDIQINHETGNQISFWIQDMDQINSKDQSIIRNKQMTGKFMNLTRSGSTDKIVIKNYDDPVIKISPIIQDDSYVQNRERIKSQDSSIQYLGGDDCNDVIIVPESSRFKFKQASSLTAMLEKKTFSFKLSTLQFHECSQSCRRVLIVDDVAFNQYALTSLLYTHQILCDKANDGYQAIERIKEKSQTSCPLYEIIFINMETPGQHIHAIKEVSFEQVNRLMIQA